MPSLYIFTRSLTTFLKKYETFPYSCNTLCMFGLFPFTMYPRHYYFSMHSSKSTNPSFIVVKPNVCLVYSFLLCVFFLCGFSLHIGMWTFLVMCNGPPAAAGKRFLLKNSLRTLINLLFICDWKLLFLTTFLRYVCTFLSRIMSTIVARHLQTAVHQPVYWSCR